MRITDKPDILQEILLSLDDLQEDIHLLLIVVHHTIRNQDGVAVTELIILRDQVLLIVLILLGRELLGAEHLEDTGFPIVKKAELLVCLLHRLLQYVGRQFLVSLEIDPVDLCLLVLVDIDIDNHLTFIRRIILLLDINLDILKALIIEETLDNRLRTVHHVRCNLITLPQSETSLQILTLTFLNTRIMHLRYTRPLFQLYFQPDLVALDFRGQDLDIREQTMFPEPLDRSCHLITRHRNLFADRQARKANQHKIIIVLHARDFDIRDLILFRGQGIRKHWNLSRPLNLSSVTFLGDRSKSETQENKEQLNLLVHIQLLFIKLIARLSYQNDARAVGNTI